MSSIKEYKTFLKKIFWLCLPYLTLIAPKLLYEQSSHTNKISSLVGIAYGFFIFLTHSKNKFENKYLQFLAFGVIYTILPAKQFWHAMTFTFLTLCEIVLFEFSQNKITEEKKYEQ